jgi:ribosomal protein S30
MSETQKNKKEEKSSRREQHSGHGSISKAGKVRDQTPKIEKTNLTKHHGPLMRNREKFINFINRKEKEKTQKRYNEPKPY